MTPPVNESTAEATRGGVRSVRDNILTLDSRRVAAEREDHHIRECGDLHRGHDEVGVVRGCCGVPERHVECSYVPGEPFNTVVQRLLSQVELTNEGI